METGSLPVKPEQQMDETEKKVKQLQKAYDLCKEVFCTGNEIMKVGDEFALDDHEKQEFFRALFAHFAKIKQKELIDKGIY